MYIHVSSRLRSHGITMGSRKVPKGSTSTPKQLRAESNSRPLQNLQGPPVAGPQGEAAERWIANDSVAYNGILHGFLTHINWGPHMEMSITLHRQKTTFFGTEMSIGCSSCYAFGWFVASCWSYCGCNHELHILSIQILFRVQWSTDEFLEAIIVACLPLVFVACGASGHDFPLANWAALGWCHSLYSAKCSTKEFDRPVIFVP